MLETELYSVTVEKVNTCYRCWSLTYYVLWRLFCQQLWELYSLGKQSWPSGARVGGPRTWHQVCACQTSESDRENWGNFEGTRILNISVFIWQTQILQSCQEKAFSFDQDGFVQQQRESAGDGTGLNICFTLKLPGLCKLERQEMLQILSESDMSLVSQTPSQAQFTLSLNKSPEYDEFTVVSKSVQMVDKIWMKDLELQSSS